MRDLAFRIVRGELPPTIEPWADELLTAFLLMRSTGVPPWALGKRLPRRRFRQAAEIFSTVFELTSTARRCPLAEL